MTRSIQSTDGYRAEAVRPVRGGESGATPQEQVQAVRPVDRVEISREGRAMAEEGGIGAGASGSSPSLAEVQQKIRDGHYDTPEMARSVAHRILESGDL